MTDTPIRTHATTGDDEPQADTPTPQGRERIDSRIEFVYTLLGERAPSDIDIEAGTADAPWWLSLRDAFDELVDLVRRDGTDPAPEEVVAWARPRDLLPRSVTATTSESHRTITVRVDRADDYYTVPLAAVRALRDGAAR